MTEEIQLGEITALVIRKGIKNVHLSVYPPNGRVRISAPIRMSLATLRIYAISKLGWIKQQQKKIQNQARQSAREYLDQESHYIWGNRFLLKVVEHDAAPSVELKARKVILRVRAGNNLIKRQGIFEQWQRDQLKQAVTPLLNKWQKILSVNVNGFYIQTMKTKWGSCTPKAKTLRVNAELIKKPPICLEYIVVHELLHLIEPTHNKRFVELLNRHMPKWQFHKDELNRLPVKHESWKY